MKGPGKCDDLAALVRERALARGVLVIVVEGKKGSGFSLHVTDPNMLLSLPAALRLIADEIERDIQGGRT